MTEVLVNNQNPIEEGWDLYQEALSKGAGDTHITNLRAFLMRRILGSTDDILNNEMFLSLIKDEKEQLTVTTSQKIPRNNIVALAEATLLRLGKTDQTKEEIIEFFNQEKEKSFLAPAVVNILSENVLHLILETENKVAREELVDFLLDQIGISVEEGLSARQKEYQSIEATRKVIDQLGVLEEIPKDSSMLIVALVLCLSAFILLKLNGDDLNARFYLTKAVDLNYEFHLNEFLILYLKHVYVSDLLNLK